MKRTSLFLLLIFITFSCSIAQSRSGTGLASDLSNSTKNKIKWERTLTTKGNNFVTKYSFYLDGAGYFNMFLSHKKENGSIYYAIFSDRSEYALDDGVLKLDEMENDGNVFYIKKDGEYADLFKIKISFLSKRKDFFKIQNYFTNDYFKLYLQFE